MHLNVLNFFDFFEVEKLRDTPLVMNVAFRKSDCFHVFGGQSDFLPFSMMVPFIAWGHSGREVGYPASPLQDVPHSHSTGRHCIQDTRTVFALRAVGFVTYCFLRRPSYRRKEV